jgi:hypothetical protein
MDRIPAASNVAREARLEPRIADRRRAQHSTALVVFAGSGVSPPSKVDWAATLLGACPGGRVETLRSAPSATLSVPVRGLVRQRFDGACAWFADPDRMPETLDELVMQSGQGVSRIADVVEKMRTERYLSTSWRPAPLTAPSIPSSLDRGLGDSEVRARVWRTSVAALTTKDSSPSTPPEIGPSANGQVFPRSECPKLQHRCPQTEVTLWLRSPSPP